MRGHIVPIVPAAILFDLVNGGDKDWGRYPPYRELGYQATAAATLDFVLGTAGAGTGALSAGLKGGLGSASLRLPSGITIGALAAVNPAGSVTVGDTRHFWAAPFEIGDEFGGRGLPSGPSPRMPPPRAGNGRTPRMPAPTQPSPSSPPTRKTDQARSQAPGRRRP